MPDAVRIEGERLVGTRHATRHEVQVRFDESAVHMRCKLRLVRTGVRCGSAVANAGQALTGRCVQAWLITQGGREVAGAAYIIDEAGVVSAVKLPNVGAPMMKAMSAPLSSYLPYDESVVYEDLTEMRKIHLASLLFNVEHRFLSEKVYSYIGNMLLAVNPYRNLTMPIPGERDPCAYYDAPVRSYYARLRGETRQQVRAPPPLFCDAGAALFQEIFRPLCMTRGAARGSVRAYVRPWCRCRLSTCE